VLEQLSIKSAININNCRGVPIEQHPSSAIDKFNKKYISFLSSFIAIWNNFYRKVFLKFFRKWKYVYQMVKNSRMRTKVKFFKGTNSLLFVAALNIIIRWWVYERQCFVLYTVTKFRTLLEDKGTFWNMWKIYFLKNV
jgi:hypothetical protein